MKHFLAARTRLQVVGNKSTACEPRFQGSLQSSWVSPTALMVSPEFLYRFLRLSAMRHSSSISWASSMFTIFTFFIIQMKQIRLVQIHYFQVMICFRDKSNVLIASVFFAFQVTKLAITQIAKIYWSTNQVLKKFGEWLSQLLFFKILIQLCRRAW